MTTLEKRLLKKPMTLEDVTKVKELDDAFFPLSQWSLDYFKRFIDDSSSTNRKSWIFWMDDLLIGYAIVKNKDSELISLEKMAVASAYQNNGFGAKIVEEITNSSDCSICLGVRQSNESAIRLYEKTGFQRVVAECHIGAEKYTNEELRVEMKWIKPK